MEFFLEIMFVVDECLFQLEFFFEHISAIDISESIVELKNGLFQFSWKHID